MKSNTHNWFGVIILKSLNIINYKILIGEKTVILLLPNQPAENIYINTFLITNLLINYKDSKSNDYSSVFGLFNNEYGLMVKKKAIKGFFKIINEKTFLSIFSGSNADAYYTNKYETEEFLGMEIRYDNKINIDSDELWIKIISIIKTNEISI